MLTRIRAALAFAAVAAVTALGGCLEDPLAPDLAPEGEARFTYSGELAGEFVAVGRLNRRNPNLGTWAIGDVQGPAGTRVLGVFGQQRRDDGLVSAMLLEWLNPAVGTVTCDETTAQCPFAMDVILGAQGAGGTSEGRYGDATGTVTLTQLTGSRAVGSFSLTLLRQDGGEEPPTLQVTGTFDVSLAFTE